MHDHRSVWSVKSRTTGKSSSARVFVIALLFAPVLGCSEDDSNSGNATGRTGRQPDPNVADSRFSSVVSAQLERYGVDPRSRLTDSRELRSDSGVMPVDSTEPAGDSTDVDPNDADPNTPTDQPISIETLELRDGLVSMIIASPRQLALALADIENAKDDMALALAAGLRDDARSTDERKALMDLAKGRPSANIASALADVTATASDAWVRGYAAWAVQQHLTAKGADAVLPALTLRLKYERDPEALGWLRETTEKIKQQLITPADDSQATPGASDDLKGQVWAWISDMSGEHFQLRGVDNARYVLPRLGPWVAAELAAAMVDQDPYVRLHTAQVLERMGSEAALGAEALERALLDPNTGVAGAAAEALVAVEGQAAEGALLRRLGKAGPAGSTAQQAAGAATAPRAPYELRVALVRSLSRLPDNPHPARLLEEFEAAPTSDMKLAASAGLLRTDHAGQILRWLAEELAADLRQGRDPAGAEEVLEGWIAGEGTDELRRDWFALAAPGDVVHTSDQVRDRRKGRSALVLAISAGTVAGD